MRVLTEKELNEVAGGNPIVIAVGIGAVASGLGTAMNGGSTQQILGSMALGGIAALSGGVAATGRVGTIVFDSFGRVIQGMTSVSATIISGSRAGSSKEEETVS